MMTTISNPEGATRGGIGQGIYSLAELKLYLAFHGTPGDADRALFWLGNALNPVEHRSRQPDYSFSDLVSLLVVRELVRVGVQPQAIKDAERYMRGRFGTARPFVTQEIATDGVEVFISSDEAEQVESASQGGGQQAQGKVLGPYLTRVAYVRTEVRDWSPAVMWSPADLVVLDPRVRFGQPVVDGTRVPTQAVAEIADTAGIDEAAARLGLEPRSARAAVRFESRLAALR